MFPRQLQAGHSSLPQRKIESGAARRSGSTVTAGAGSTPAAFYLGLCRLRGILPLPASHDHAAGGPFFFVAAKIRIGHGRSLSRRSLQAGHSPLPLRKLETAAEVVVSTVTAGGPFFFAATKIGNGHGTPLRLRILQTQGCFRGKACIDSQVWA